jgi:hypothetical protein
LRPIRDVVQVDSIAETVVGKVIEGGYQDSPDRHTKRNVHDVIVETPAIGKAGRIAADQSQASRVR